MCDFARLQESEMARVTLVPRRYDMQDRSVFVPTPRFESPLCITFLFWFSLNIKGGGSTTMALPISVSRINEHHPSLLVSEMGG